MPRRIRCERTLRGFIFAAAATSGELAGDGIIIYRFVARTETANFLLHRRRRRLRAASISRNRLGGDTDRRRTIDRTTISGLAGWRAGPGRDTGIPCTGWTELNRN